MVSSTSKLKNLMGQILMSPFVQRIDFSYEGFHVDGSGYTFVALALNRQARKGQSGFSIAVGSSGPGAEATYDPKTNTFKFPNAAYGSTPFHKSQIVHECTHALRDCLGGIVRQKIGPGKSVGSISEEVAAYIAGYIYYIVSTTPASVAVTPNWCTGTDVHSEAFKVANQFRQQLIAGYQVTATDAAALRAAVTSQYGHLNSTSKYANNGVKL